MRRWLKITIAVLVGLLLLLLLNAVAVSNETKDAEVNVEGAQLVETAYGDVQVLDEGNKAGPPIVLVHCYTCSMVWWDDLAALLGKDHRVIRVDLLGHGGSEKPGADDAYSIETQASAVAEAVSTLGVQGATVVGHSLGGTVVTALAEQSPELASRAVIIDQAVNNDDSHSSLAQRMGYVPVLGQGLYRLTHWAPASTVRAQYDEVFAPGYNISSGFENPDQVVDDLREMTNTAYVQAADAENDYTDEKPLNERLAANGVPLLVIFGADDQIYDAEESLADYKNVPNVQSQLIQGAGHSPNVEKPNEVAPLITAFAAGQAPAPAKKTKAKAAP